MPFGILTQHDVIKGLINSDASLRELWSLTMTTCSMIEEHSIKEKQYDESDLRDRLIFTKNAFAIHKTSIENAPILTGKNN